MFPQSVTTDESNAGLNIVDNSDSLINPYFYEPYPQSIGDLLLQLGGSFTLLATPGVEEVPIPTIDLQLKYGVMKKISLVSSLSTNYFSNYLQLGLQWNTNSSRFSFGMANHFGGFVGTYHLTLFKENFAYAFSYMPIISVGIRADEFSATISIGASYMFYSETRVGKLKVQDRKDVWNDIFCTMAIEQPMFRSTLMSIGFNFTYCRSSNLAWFFYDTTDQYQILPKFFLSIQL